MGEMGGVSLEGEADCEAGWEARKKEVPVIPVLDAFGGIGATMDDGSAFPASEATPGQMTSRVKYGEFLAGLANLPWGEEYLRLREEGWDWRKAAYMAWCAMPTSKREPKTQEALAEMLGCTTRVMRRWRKKKPEMDQRIEAATVGMLRDGLADVLEAWLLVAKLPDPTAHRDRITYLEAMGVYKPKAPTATNMNVDLDALTDEQLERIAAGEEPAHVLATSSKSGD